MAYDRPYIMAFDADSLTNGQTYNNLVLQAENDWDFYARRMTGLQNVAAQLMLRDDQQRMRFQAPINTPKDWIHIPQIETMRAGNIGFDLHTVAKAQNTYVTPNSIPNYYSQLIWQGLRRFDQGAELVTPYRSYDYPQTLRHQMTINYAGRVAPAYTAPENPRFFVKPVETFDFVMLGMNITIQTATDVGPVQASGKVKLLVQDASRLQMSNVPIVDQYLSVGNQDYKSVFPVPGVLYPTQSQIGVWVTSLLVEAEVPATLFIDYVGYYRRPC